MTELKRPDGADIHWEATGEGPTVALVHPVLWSYPGLYGNLVSELARDHRVITYDPRGCGRSRGRGPYDMGTDAGDLEAVLDAAGGAQVAVAVGEGLNRAARVAVARPEVLANLIAIAPAAAAVLPRAELRGSGVIAASDSVIEVLLQMMDTEPRAALRSVITAINPGLNDDELRERVDRASDYLSLDAVADRARAWLEDDLTAHLTALGDRVSILHGGADPLFEGAMKARVAELFPLARIEQITDGPISRPDITSERVRRLTVRSAP